MENKSNAGKNIQRHAYLLTINNPKEYGFTHEVIKETIIKGFSTITYFCMADEIGEQGTPHTHIYLVFSSRVRWSTVKKHFEVAHIDEAYGTAEANVNYIKKSGKWENTNKAETSIEGTFEEWGTFPEQKGTNFDLQELYQMIVNDGLNNAEILAINNDYIMQIDKLDKVRTTVMTEKYKDIRRLNLKVCYIFGATGTGKTRGILDTHGNSAVYRVTDYEHSFDGYNCQKVLAFDEFRSQLRISDMLNYLDIYPIELPARYANKYACYETVYIVSNWSLEEQYREVQENHPESWSAFLRRIHEVRHHKKDGSIDIYNSVDEYFNRNSKFIPVSEVQIELPFK